MLTFKKLDELLEPYEILKVENGDGKRHEFLFRRKRLPTGKRNLLTKVSELKNGELSGYIYVGHLREFDKHPDRKKMGYIPIRNLSEEEFEAILKRVIKEYR